MHITPYVAVVLASWCAFSVVWAVKARSAKPSRRRSLWRSRALRVLLIFLLLTRRHLAWSPYLHPTTTLMSFAGCAICIAGLGFAVWARASLGPNWGMPMTVRENPELVMNGPYAFVRHPIYTGVFVAMLGTALVVPIYAVVAFVSACWFTYSAYREEKDMLREFPAEYRAYRQRTKMFFPFLF